MCKLNEPIGMDFEPEPKDLIRFLGKVRKDRKTGCWVWEGHRDPSGYGQFRFKGKTHWAARWSYAVFRRPLIAGLTIEHKCRNTSCVNPWHFELLLLEENVQAMHEAKGYGFDYF